MSVTSNTWTGVATGAALGGLTAVAARTRGATLAAAGGGVLLGALASHAGRHGGRSIANPSVHVPAATGGLVAAATGVSWMHSAGYNVQRIAGTSGSVLAAALGGYAVAQFAHVLGRMEP